MQKHNNSIQMFRTKKQTNGALIVYLEMHAYPCKPIKLENWSNAFPILYQPSYKA